MDLVGRVNTGLRKLATGLGMLAIAVNSYGQFGNARPVQGLNSESAESHAIVSSDNLRCFFGTSRIIGELDVWYAERNTPEEPFVIVGEVENINSAFSDRPNALSTDELRLYLSTRNTGEGWNIYTTERLDLSSPFNRPSPIPELTTSGSELDPTVSVNELEMYFEYLDGLRNNKIVKTTRLDRLAPWNAP